MEPRRVVAELRGLELRRDGLLLPAELLEAEPEIGPALAAQGGRVDGLLEQPAGLGVAVGAIGLRRLVRERAGRAGADDEEGERGEVEHHRAQVKRASMCLVCGNRSNSCSDTGR